METREILFRIIRIGIVLVFLTPLILGPFGLNMSEYPKAVFFRSLIEIIFVFYIFLILLNPAYLPKKSLLLFSVIIFDAVLVIASIYGINFYRSFFGEMQRGEGIILHLHLLVFFIILIGLFRKKKDWLWLFKATVIISGLVSMAAVLQQMKISSFYNVESSRMSGTLSNPDLFGSYIVLAIYLAIFLLACEQKKNFKILWISLIILNFYTLILSGIRASLAGFAFGVACICLLNYKHLNYKKRIYFLLIILVISLLMLFLPAIIGRTHLENSNFGQRILSIYNINISNRLTLWEVAFRAFKDKPVLGWGFESFSFVYDKYFQNNYTKGVYFDRSHNKIMDILAYSGTVGLAAYLLIFFVIFYLIFRYSKLWNGYNNKPGILFASIIFAFFISGFIQNIFGFDHIGTYILFFLAAAFVNNNFSPRANFKEINLPVSAEKIIFIASIAVFMAFVIYQINIKPTASAMNFNSSVQYEGSDTARALDGYKNGISMSTLYDNDLVLAFTDRSIFLLESSYGQNIGEKAVAELLKIKPVLYEGIIKKDERPINLFEFLIRIDEWSHIVRKDPSYLNDMKEDIGWAIAFNPNVPVFYQLRGEMEILQDKNSEGEKDIKKSCYMDSVSCGGSVAQSYQMIGFAYYKKGDIKNAIKNFQSALDADSMGILSNGAQFADSVAIMYYNYLKDFKSCEKIYEKAMEAYPDYKDVFSQHLSLITADYEKNK